MILLARFPIIGAFLMMVIGCADLCHQPSVDEVVLDTSVSNFDESEGVIRVTLRNSSDESLVFENGKFNFFVSSVERNGDVDASMSTTDITPYYERSRADLGEKVVVNSGKEYSFELLFEVRKRDSEEVILQIDEIASFNLTKADHHISFLIGAVGDSSCIWGPDAPYWSTTRVELELD